MYFINEKVLKKDLQMRALLELIICDYLYDFRLI